MKIQNIWAVGRNYSDHAKEMGQAVPEEPMIFLKAGSCAIEKEFHLPAFSKDVHHEAEIAIQFDQNLKVSAATLALDLTARDIQAELKSKKHPWTLAKSFRESCPIGPFFPITSLQELESLEFTLHVNGELRQTGRTREMVFGFSELIKYVLERFPVQPGDLLLTGTPAGVAALKPGDFAEGEIKNRMKVVWRVLE